MPLITSGAVSIKHVKEEVLIQDQVPTYLHNLILHDLTDLRSSLLLRDSLTAVLKEKATFWAAILHTQSTDNYK